MVCFVCVLFLFITTQVDQEHILIYSNGREGEESGLECVCVCGGSIFMHGHANICHFSTCASCMTDTFTKLKL